MTKDDSDEKARDEKKKPYQKPELTKVELRPEEAILGACKTSGGGGPSGPCEMMGCSTNGS